MRFKKGSAAAKAFMAKLRAAKGKPKKSAAKKKAAPKKKTAHVKIGAAVPKKHKARKKTATKRSPLHKDTQSHNVRISVASGIGSIMTHFKDQYGKLASKKLMEKTKREKNKIAKEMSVIAAKLKKLKNFLA
jgi:hypothetical protein